ILADHMDVGGPETRKIARSIGVANARQIGREGVDPHIHDMPRRIRDWNAPVEAGARDAEILEPALDEAQHLVAAAFRADEIGVVAIEREKPVLVGREAEEPAFLDGPFDRCSLRRELYPPFPFEELAF